MEVCKPFEPAGSLERAKQARNRGREGLTGGNGGGGGATLAVSKVDIGKKKAAPPTFGGKIGFLGDDAHAYLWVAKPRKKAEVRETRPAEREETLERNE